MYLNKGFKIQFSFDKYINLPSLIYFIQEKKDTTYVNLNILFFFSNFFLQLSFLY